MRRGAGPYCRIPETTEGTSNLWISSSPTPLRYQLGTGEGFFIVPRGDRRPRPNPTPPDVGLRLPLPSARRSLSSR